MTQCCLDADLFFLTVLSFGSSSLAGKEVIKGLAALNMGGGDNRTEMENREGILVVKEMVE